MQIVIVEDRPWKLEKSIQNMREEGITVNNIIYVNKDIEIAEPELAQNLQELQNHLPGLEITITDNSAFNDTMQTFYNDDNNLLLCDLNLSGTEQVLFELRANVIFARRIMDAEPNNEPSKRIWFYTTAGETTNEQINVAFPGRNISVITMEEDQVILDIEEIHEALEINEG